MNIGANLPGIANGTVAWGDYDNDGLLDILLAGGGSAGNPITRLFHNNGDGTFSDTLLELPGIGYTGASATWADYNNDGNLDFLLTATGRSPLFRNNDVRTNLPPSAPTGLTTAVDGNSVTLSWAPATDSNQSGGLSYNVRIGTSPGKENALSPMSDPATGVRLLPKFGNAGQRLDWTLANLKPGRYFWSVQAIDHAYAGSPFANEAGFVLVIISEGATSITTTSATLNGSAYPDGLSTSVYFEYGLTTNYGNTTIVQGVGSGNRRERSPFPRSGFTTPILHSTVAIPALVELVRWTH